MKKQMICISGNIAVGKTEVAAKLAEKLGYGLYKASESFRRLARDNNMDLVEFNDFVKSNPDIDKNIEAKTKEVIDSNTNMIIDARLGFFLGPKAFRVYMIADESVAAERLFKASKKRGKEEEYASVEQAKEAIKIREASEQERYLKLYNVNIHDMDNYDYVIDTTNLSSDEVASKIIRAYKVWCEVDFDEG
ncbi:MAG: cytidylate kinase family protein [Clostridia bacterium]|nr:cytidylate kinase family protein [Clostridia bacterium]